MSFNLYFAGSQAKEVHDFMQSIGGSRLFTFADGPKCVNGQINAFTGSGKIFIDSGAYSIARSGRTVSIDDYVAFVNSTDVPEVFASLDAIPFPELNAKTAKECSQKSWENYLYIVDRVKEETKHKILPVYHFGEPLEYLELILNTEIDGHLIDYMGLGGGNAGVFAKNIDYYNNVFSIIKKSKNPNIKVHAFGMTVPKLLEMFPFYSADSTTWLMLGINGNIITKCCGTVCVSERQQDSNTHVSKLCSEKQELINEELSYVGTTLEEVSKCYKKRLIQNVKYFKDWADNYEFKGFNKKRKKLF